MTAPTPGDTYALGAVAASMKPRQLTCSHCRRPFTWTPTQPSDPAPKYHSKACQHRARKARRDGLDPATPGFCITPHKRTYPTPEDAWAHIRDDFPHDPDLRPYRCPCGAVHIGHDHTRREDT